MIVRQTIVILCLGVFLNQQYSESYMKHCVIEGAGDPSPNWMPWTGYTIEERNLRTVGLNYFNQYAVEC